MRFHGNLRISTLRLGCAVAAAVLLAACSAMHVTSEGGDSDLMLNGHDPVAYFSAGRPTPGRPDIKVVHRGATYRFASDENRRQFITHPERFAPRYGGFCANDMAYAMPTAGDPASFKIIDGRLYLFGGARAKLYFEMDQERNLRLANHYWETEVEDGNRYLQYLKRQVCRVPHYKSDDQLAEEYARRFGKAPG